jgi:hypothetical protein
MNGREASVYTLTLTHQLAGVFKGNICQAWMIDGLCLRVGVIAHDHEMRIAEKGRLTDKVNFISKWNTVMTCVKI